MAILGSREISPVVSSQSKAHSGVHGCTRAVWTDVQGGKGASVAESGKDFHPARIHLGLLTLGVLHRSPCSLCAGLPSKPARLPRGRPETAENKWPLPRLTPPTGFWGLMLVVIAVASTAQTRALHYRELSKIFFFEGGGVGSMGYLCRV